MGTGASEPRVSIVIPTFQRRELVLEAIESVEAQSYRDFELIVVDDGSTDGTRAALEAHPGAIRYRWHPHRGVSAARNLGVELSRARIIAFLDSDNLWLSDHLAVVTELLERFPRAVLATTSTGYRLSGKATTDQARLVEFERPALGASSAGGYLSGIAVRRSALQRAGGFDARVQAGEDSDLKARLATIGPFVVLARQTFIRRIAQESLERSARARGEYVGASEREAQNLLALAGRLPEPRRSRIASEADGLKRFARALRAIERDDGVSLRGELAAACDRLPLSDSPAWVDDKLPRALRDDHELARRLGKAAIHGDLATGRLRTRLLALEAWPDPGAPTPRYLRLLAIGSALRLRRFGVAFRLIAGWPLRGSVAAAPVVLAGFRERLGRARAQTAPARWSSRWAGGTGASAIAGSGTEEPPPGAMQGSASPEARSSPFSMQRIRSLWG